MFLAIPGQWGWGVETVKQTTINIFSLYNVPETSKKSKDKAGNIIEKIPAFMALTF